MRQLEEVLTALKFQALMICLPKTSLSGVQESCISVPWNSRSPDELTATVSALKQLAGFLIPNAGPDIYLIVLDSDYASSL